MRKPRSSKLVSRRTILATILASDTHKQQKQLTYGFLNRHVIVKAAKFAIRGTLKGVDPSEQHSGLGNLVLEDSSIIRGNSVYAICTERKPRE